MTDCPVLLIAICHFSAQRCSTVSLDVLAISRVRTGDSQCWNDVSVVRMLQNKPNTSGKAADDSLTLKETTSGKISHKSGWKNVDAAKICGASQMVSTAALTYASRW